MLACLISAHLCAPTLGSPKFLASIFLKLVLGKFSNDFRGHIVVHNRIELWAIAVGIISVIFKLFAVLAAKKNSANIVPVDVVNV